MLINGARSLFFVCQSFISTELFDVFVMCSRTLLFCLNFIHKAKRFQGPALWIFFRFLPKRNQKYDWTIENDKHNIQPSTINGKQPPVLFHLLFCWFCFLFTLLFIILIWCFHFQIFSSFCNFKKTAKTKIWIEK